MMFKKFLVRKKDWVPAGWGGWGNLKELYSPLFIQTVFLSHLKCSSTFPTQILPYWWCKLCPCYMPDSKALTAEYKLVWTLNWQNLKKQIMLSFRIWVDGMEIKVNRSKLDGSCISEQVSLNTLCILSTFVLWAAQLFCCWLPWTLVPDPWLIADLWNASRGWLFWKWMWWPQLQNWRRREEVWGAWLWWSGHCGP